MLHYRYEETSQNNTLMNYISFLDISHIPAMRNLYCYKVWNWLALLKSTFLSFPENFSHRKLFRFLSSAMRTSIDRSARIFHFHLMAHCVEGLGTKLCRTNTMTKIEWTLNSTQRTVIERTDDKITTCRERHCAPLKAMQTSSSPPLRFTEAVSTV